MYLFPTAKHSSQFEPHWSKALFHSLLYPSVMALSGSSSSLFCIREWSAGRLTLITGVTVSQCAAKHAAAPCCYQAAGPAQPLVGTAAGPAHKQPAVKEQPLVRGFSPLSEWWSSGGEQGKRQIPAFSPEPRSLFPDLRLAGELGSLGSRLGAVSCRAPEPPRPLTGRAQALRPWWTSPPPSPLGPHDSGHLLGSASVGPGPPLTHSSGSLRAVGLPSGYLSWEGPGDLAWTEGQWRPTSSQPGPPLTLRGWKLYLRDLSLSCQNWE